MALARGTALLARRQTPPPVALLRRCRPAEMAPVAAGALLTPGLRRGLRDSAAAASSKRPSLAKSSSKPSKPSTKQATKAPKPPGMISAFPSVDGKGWSLRSRLAGHWKNHRPDGVDPLLAEKAATQLLRKPEKAAQVLSKMPMDVRRAVALSWALTELEEEFAKADTDKDGKLDYKDFRKWALKVIETGPKRDATPEISREQCVAITVTTMVPFIGFGFVDNGLMVIYGDVIDGTLGMYLGFSMLASAALGNAISNIFGMLLHGTITKWADKVGLPDARLTLAQRKMPRTHFYSTMGSTIGVFVGCLLGMSPLLFMDQKKKEAERSAEKVHAEHHQ